ncbi:O-antigen ligase family protein [Candidatus Daviesbacteria bacterium]|nr:O-antigen ligase family protein [Candidatus Daviesbacteria bacterium]
MKWKLLSLILALGIISGQLIKIPIGVGGFIFLDITVIILLSLGLLEKRFKLSYPTNYINAALLFVLAGTISLLLTPLHLAFSEYLTSFFYIVRFASYVLLGWVLYSKALPEIKDNISNILVVSGIVIAILGLLQFILLPDLRFLENQGWDPHYLRTVSTFLDPNFAGAFFVLSLILVLQNLAIAKKWNTVLFVLIYLALLTTFSRSSYMMFLTSFLIISLLKKSIRLGFISVALFFGLLLGFWIYTQTVSQPRNINRQLSAESRLTTWQQGWNIFQHSPIFGVGFNAYRYAIREYSLADSTFLKSHGSSTNDSSLLYVLATTGVVGFLAYLTFLGLILKTTWHKINSDKSISLIVLSAIGGLLIHSIFNNSLFYPQILLWLILVTSLL